MKKQLNILLIIALFYNTACSKETQTDSTDQKDTLTIVEAFPELSFTRPVDFQHAGDDSNRLFIVEQRGVISIFQNDEKQQPKQLF